MNQLETCPHCGMRLVPSPAEIRELRTAAGLSQDELAERLGVRGTYISYLEKGRRNPSGDFVLRYRKIERALQTKLDRRS